MTAFITGATGFVGRSLCAHLHQVKGWRLIGLGRRLPTADVARDLKDFVSADLSLNPDLQDALKGVDVIVHLASRVHEMKGDGSLEAYRDANVKPALHLAKQAVLAGVRRLIFISTIKVNGEETAQVPFSGEQRPAPGDPYAQSKLEAEEALLKVAEGSQLEIVILRPPLVYGPGVRANFLNLMSLASLRLPLPFGSIRNRRSFIHVDNLVAAIVVAAESEHVKNKVFTISDDGALSTPDLMTKICGSMGRRVFLVPFPVSLLSWFVGLFGFSQEISRLVVSLEADNSKFKEITGWKPVKTTDEGLRDTVQWFLNQSR